MGRLGSLLLTGKSALTSEHQCVTNTHKHTKLTCNKTEYNIKLIKAAINKKRHNMVGEDKFKKSV